MKTKMRMLASAHTAGLSTSIVSDFGGEFRESRPNKSSNYASSSSISTILTNARKVSGSRIALKRPSVSYDELPQIEGLSKEQACFSNSPPYIFTNDFLKVAEFKGRSTLI